MAPDPIIRALGADFSFWNETVDFPKAASAGLLFVGIKACQMTVDPKFLTYWPAAKAAGLPRCAYHYLDWRMDELAQARMFCDLLKDDPGELPPVVDFECPWNIPEKAVCDGKLWNFVSYVERTLGKTPMIYTGFYFWQDHTFCGPSWAKYPLWLAWYAPENVIRVPPPWSKWTIWQYTGNGPGPQYGSEGLSLDMDWFNGTPEELSAFIHGEPPVPPAPAPVPTYPQYLTLVGVNVRSGPTDISPVIGTLPADATISVDTIDAYHGRSHYSNYSGKPGEPPAGWVWTAYTKLVATPVPGPALPQYKVNPGYNLNIHSGPSGTTSVIGLAAAGTVMYIDQGPTNGYIHFDNSVGIHNPSLPSNGWVWGPYCSQV